MDTTCNIHILEDDCRYIEIDSIVVNEIKYLLLSQDINQTNICLRKIVKDEENNQKYALLSSKEFDEIYEKLLEKNKNLFE
ncbi:MAG: hypothetical protein IJ399_04215 [Bacilli bacterium]|nr:hypothetical protein [Bacilli bacterium]